MTNDFISGLLGKANDRFSIDSINMPISEWICKNTTLKKRPFSFKDYEFQREIADDMHDDLNVIKISQIGLTEIQIRKALSLLVRNRGTSLIFSLPNEDMFNRVSKARVKPIVNADKVFNTAEDTGNRAVRATDMMQFGQSFLYLVPAIESAATSIAADFVFNDEVDLSDQKMIALFNSRLQGSKYRISQKFSTPTFPSYGIDLNWQTSDQKLYLCQCEACNHYNHPEFNQDFVHLPGMPDVKELTDITIEHADKLEFENAYIKCEKCGNPLDLDNNRQWVAMFNERRGTRGYRINPFVTSTLDLKYIFKSMWNYQKNDFRRGFYNTVLGLPYSDGSMQIPIQDIQACMFGNPQVTNLDDYKNQDMWIGIDVGQICHVVIGVGPNSEQLDVISMYTVHIQDLVKHVTELCETYPIRGGCIDRHPYEPTAGELFKATKGTVVPTEHRGSKDVNLVKNEFGEIYCAQVNHTSFLDNLATRIRKHSIKISGYGHYKQVYQEHLRDLVREETPEKPAHWVKLNGNDHFFHATCFMLRAPHVKEVLQFGDKSDIRSMIVASVVPMANRADNLIGISNKRVDNSLIIR